VCLFDLKLMANEIFAADLAEKLFAGGVVAVLVVDEVEDAVPLARALLDGGIGAMELTLRTPAGLEAVRRISDEVPEMLAGAGTVLTIDQLHAVQSAGAAFAVAPGMNPRVVAEAAQIGLSFAPGICTPSEIEQALEFGCRYLKFFPCEASGGLAYLRNIAAPYAHLGLKYIPLGGLNAKNMAEYLREPMVAALGGSWIAPRELIQAKDWSGIKERAAEAATIARSVRPLSAGR
jgi:2-dehydro-3-deoxyphosphogluconate aldolase / (4S)-4-hydroxy-2-oxoglutarate aldolase